MTIGEFQKKSVTKLEKSRIDSAQLDVLVLLEDVLGKDRSWILAHPESPLATTYVRVLDKKIARRTLHEPLAYIRGKTEFYRRNFCVNKYILEPRPESETIITLLKPLVRQSSTPGELHIDKVIDVGTGSGALAITVKLEQPDTDVIAIDIDPNCLKVAQKNAKIHGVNIKYLQGDLLEPLSADYQLSTAILMANLPYVPDDSTINLAASMEPKIAIFGGPDGLDIYRRLFEQLSGQNKPKYVLSESMPSQHRKLAKIALEAGYVADNTEGFIQVFLKK